MVAATDEVRPLPLSTGTVTHIDNIMEQLLHAYLGVLSRGRAVSTAVDTSATARSCRNACCGLLGYVNGLGSGCSFSSGSSSCGACRVDGLAVWPLGVLLLGYAGYCTFLWFDRVAGAAA